MLCGNHSSFGLLTESKDKANVTIEYLDSYAKDAWEAVLHYLVGTPSNKKPSAVMALMEHSGLMAAGSGSKELRITNKGFQFLLQDVNEQLGSLELGQDYSITSLTDTQRQMLGIFPASLFETYLKKNCFCSEDLKHLGLVYQRKSKSSRFYPTRLATSLTSGAAVSGETGESGYIIVETNFKVYAYTNSPLQIAVLSLFVSLKARFANMVIGVLTRDSVREAFNNGISASQITQFLANHAHSEMKKVLPNTVVDQIRLWESERKRAVAHASHLYSDFGRIQDYLEVLSELGYVLWNSDEKKLIIVSPEGHVRVREFLQRRGK
ncbi:RNA polymerase II transcription factor B 52 kDa subunit [Physocladia obscura]|uniref:RNA polymerase II transcription factor B subunit 2 n=1 Tax=Physocladia obscura TaxID=109957 RepID=A0AAD5XJS1_9FUNG|nr:RNA polymerase II transcription factor B 52 kDa subunit [Physocladia obscura]